jgi:hypothetical protein
VTPPDLPCWVADVLSRRSCWQPERGPGIMGGYVLVDDRPRPTTLRSGSATASRMRAGSTTSSASDRRPVVAFGSFVLGLGRGEQCVEDSFVLSSLR